VGIDDKTAHGRGCPCIHNAFIGKFKTFTTEITQEVGGPGGPPLHGSELSDKSVRPKRAMTDFRQFVPGHIRRLAEAGNTKPLKQAGATVALESGKAAHNEEGAEPVALNLNENPFGPSPLAMQALHTALAEVHRYPEIQADDLHNEIASFHGVGREQVLVTAGATELLCMIARALLGPGLKAITSAKSFIVYKLATQVTEGRLIEVPTRNNGYDLVGMLKAIDASTRIVFIANPNNPTGTLLTADEVDGFVDRLPEHVLLVLDEAYGDFAEAFAQQRGVTYTRAMNYIEAGKNIILLKTFSKAHGLAGLRVGYGIGPERLISLFAPMRVVFSVSSAAQSAASAALRDAEHIRRAVENNTGQSEVLSAALQELGFPAPQSWANFLYCEMGEDVAQFAERLREHGVIVQPLGMWGAPSAIRVSIGTPAQNARLVEVLRNVRQ
jgi:histidinol-phosphate aminotransferase